MPLNGTGNGIVAIARSATSATNTTDVSNYMATITDCPCFDSEHLCLQVTPGLTSPSLTALVDTPPHAPAPKPKAARLSCGNPARMKEQGWERGADYEFGAAFSTRAPARKPAHISSHRDHV